MDKKDDEIDVAEARKKAIKFFKGIFSSGHSSTESHEEKELEDRRKHTLKFLKEKWEWLAYAALAVIIWVTTSMRMANLPLLKDITTGKFLPTGLDPDLFLRYAKYIIENGALYVWDTTRFVPVGRTMADNWFLSYFIAYFYKLLNIFNPNVTLEYADVIYPAVAFAVGIAVFFVLVRKLFDTKVALLASAFLSVAPPYLFRTTAGFADKEALGMIFMFSGLYLYVKGWESKKWWHSLLWGAGAGTLTALMGLVWGGWKFVVLIISLFALVEFFLHKMKREEYYLYLGWIMAYTVILTWITGRFTLSRLFLSATTGIAYLILAIIAVHFVLFETDALGIKKRIKEKIPYPAMSMLLCLAAGIPVVLIAFGKKFFDAQFKETLTALLHPLGTNRWMLTVAEQHQPYFTDWIGQFGPVLFTVPSYFALFFLGSIIMFHYLVRPLEKGRWILTAAYTLFISAFIFSRYSPQSYLNGTNPISKTLYLGSLAVFSLFVVFLYLRAFYTDKDTYHRIKSIEKRFIFLIIMFIILVVAARGAIRLFFIFAPITAILAAYFVMSVYSFAFRMKDKLYTYSIIAIITLLVFSPFSFAFEGILYNHYKISKSSAQYTGPSYNRQWQIAGQWARENVPKDAVFGHWWDYGYWVQTQWERATFVDGANSYVYWNYLNGRHVLTGQSQQEALEFLWAHNVTHFLIVEDEIGKYTAYSSIGSDKDFDRYSWITTFSLDSKQTQETREGTVYFYRGGYSLDDDFVYQGRTYPRGAAGIGAVLLPVETVVIDNTSMERIKQPEAILVYGGQQQRVPLECVYIGDPRGNSGQMLKFENEGLKGCFRIIPTIGGNGNVENPKGAGLYVSEEGVKALWTNLFLFNQNNPDFDTSAFKLAYNDEENMPLSLFQGRLIGPLKVWEVVYPENFSISEELYQNYINTSDSMLPDYFFEVG